MIEEKFYVLEDGTELILMTRSIINEKKYLLLFNEKAQEFKIATDENNELNYITKEAADYEYILDTLMDKLKTMI